MTRFDGTGIGRLGSGRLPPTGGLSCLPAASAGGGYAPSTGRTTAVTKGKRTFQPNNRHRAKTHGFRVRMRTRAGRAIIAARRRKGRTELSA